MHAIQKLLQPIFKFNCITSRSKRKKTPPKLQNEMKFKYCFHIAVAYLFVLCRSQIKNHISYRLPHCALNIQCIHLDFDGGPLHAMLVQPLLVQLPGQLLGEVRILHMDDGVCSQQFTIKSCFCYKLVLWSFGVVTPCENVCNVIFTT